MERTFTVTGTHDGKPARITWTEGRGFEEVPPGLVSLLRARTERICQTPTGPCYEPADAPAYVALLTAKQALDTLESLEGPDAEAVALELEREAEIPEGAVS